MTQRYQELLFSPAVRAAQAALGSTGYPENQRSKLRTA